MPTLDKTLDAFIGVTGQSKVTVVLPMFGYWSDSEVQQFDEQTLKLTLDRIYSRTHQLYVLFVADEKRLTKEVANVIVGYSQAGNAKGITVKTSASYTDYLRAGLSAAMDETKCDYVVVVNPWTLLQHNAIDMIVDRVNREDVKIACGYDIKQILNPEQFMKGYTVDTPKEERNISFNFICFKRALAEMIKVDTEFKTHDFFERDLWQSCFSQGFESIVSQKIPIFTFDVDWELLEKPAAVEADRLYFTKKWGYTPDTKHDK